MARDIPALYDTIASQVVDRLVEFGEARVSNVPDTELLRAAVRRTARRRNVKLLSPYRAGRFRDRRGHGTWS